VTAEGGGGAGAAVLLLCAAREAAPRRRRRQGRGGEESPALVKGRGREESPTVEGKRREEEDDMSDPHISQLVAGVFEAIRKYVSLQMGPRASNTYKRACLREEKNCNGIVRNR